jgi:hypothetical protein
MEGEQKKSGWKIWVYMTPLYILVAVPLVKWTMKINSPDLKLSKDEYGAFNASEGEVKKYSGEQYDPDLADSGYSIRYRSGKAGAPAEQPLSGGDRRTGGGDALGDDSRQEQGRRDARQDGRQYKQQSAKQSALESDDTKNKEQGSIGAHAGYMTAVVGKVMNNPKAVSALFNNKYVVNAFMSRGTVKAATGSTQGLANYLKGDGPMNFINNPVVKAAMNNPAIVSAVASSGLAAAMLNTPAAQALMNDPKALADLVDSNPQLVAAAMQNPQTMTMLMSNPSVSGIVGKFDTSGLKK